MFQALVHLLSAAVLTYVASRLFLRAPWFPATERGLRIAHAASYLVLLGLVFALKYPVDGFDRSSPFLLAVVQAGWFFLDRLRGRFPRTRTVI